jgi:hypothetical protein
MPPPYQQMPTKAGWLTDLGGSWTVGPLNRVSDLIGQYSVLAPQGALQAANVDHVVYSLYVNLIFIEKWHNNQAKLGGVLTIQQLNAVEGLRHYLRSLLINRLNLDTNIEFNTEMLNHFGKPVNDQSAQGRSKKSWITEFFHRRLESSV